MTSHTAGFQLTADRARDLSQQLEAVQGVAGLYAGTYNEVALLYPGERIAGLKHLNVKDDTQLAVHVVFDVAAGRSTDEVAANIRESARSAVPELSRIDVIFADVA